jgi:hydrogenase maturation protease
MPQNRTTTIKLIGIGQEWRQDDSAGLRVLRRLQGQLPPEVPAIATADVTDLIDLWQGCDRVYLFDAVKSQSAPGTLIRIAAHHQPLPAQWSSYSTHGVGLADMVELARTLGQLPSQLIVYGISGSAFGIGCELSAAVERAVEALVPQVRAEIRGRQQA